MKCNVKAKRGFTLLEVLIAVAIVGILAAIALPTYRSFIVKQKVVAAQNDLASLALNMENQFQQQLAYPTTGVPTSTTSGTQTLLWPSGAAGWNPAQGADFKYTISASTATTYTVIATGTSSALSTCVVTLTSVNARSLSAGCGGSAVWF